MRNIIVQGLNDSIEIRHQTFNYFKLVIICNQIFDWINNVSESLLITFNWLSSSTSVSKLISEFIFEKCDLVTGIKFSEIKQ